MDTGRGDRALSCGGTFFQCTGGQTLGGVDDCWSNWDGEGDLEREASSCGCQYLLYHLGTEVIPSAACFWVTKDSPFHHVQS